MECSSIIEHHHNDLNFVRIEVYFPLFSLIFLMSLRYGWTNLLINDLTEVFKLLNEIFRDIMICMKGLVILDVEW